MYSKSIKTLPANCTKSTKMEGLPNRTIESRPHGDAVHSPTISVENTMEWEKEGEKIVKKSKLPLTKAASSCKIRRTLKNGRLCGFAPCQIPRIKRHFPVDPAKLINHSSQRN